jgi:hypothetical protein
MMGVNWTFHRGILPPKGRKYINGVDGFCEINSWKAIIIGETLAPQNLEWEMVF